MVALPPFRPTRVDRSRFGPGLAVLLALVLGACSAPRTERDPSPDANRARAAPVDPGAVILMSFRGTTVPDYVTRILRLERAAGVFLAGSNIVSRPQLRALCAQLRRAGGPDVLIAVDQEGGEIRDVPGIGPELGQDRSSDPAAVRLAARDAGRELRDLGVTVDFAPVADLPTGFIKSRSYPGDRDQVAALTAAAVEGFVAGGVLPTAKHFPGLGSSTGNTDDIVATVDAPRTELERDDLEPFRAAIAAEVPLIMVGHARYPAWDPDRVASQSPTILKDVLRDDLGFEGTVVTDSLEAESSLSTGSVDQVALRSLMAGSDLLLTTGPGSWIRVRERLRRAAQRYDDVRARIAEAAGRIRALRAAL